MLRWQAATPVVLQAEQNECGLASLTMIANHFGHRLDLAAARHRFRQLNYGPSLRSILASADALGLVARPIRLELEELRRLKLPAILHWQFDHFVVLVRLHRRRVTIHDPAVGRRRITPRQFDEAFTGVAIEFTRSAHFESQSSPRATLMRGLLRSVDGLGKFLGLMLTLLLVTNLLALAPPVATQLLIDEVVLGQDHSWLHRALAGIGLVMLATLFLDTLRRWIALYAGTRLASESSTAVVRHLLRLPVATVAQRQVGDLLSRVDSLKPIRAALLDTCLQAVVQFVILTTTLALMLFYSPGLTALAAATLLLVTGMHAVLLPAMRALNLESLLASAQASNSLIETLRSFHSVRALGLDMQRLAHWQRAFLEATNAGAKQAKLGIAATFTQGLLGTTEQLLFLGIGISGVAGKQLTLGILFAFFTLRGRLSVAAVQLIASLQELYLLRSHLQRVAEIVSEAPEPHAPDGALRERIDGAIDCRLVTFHYPGGPPVLTAFECSIEAGENVVLTGPSGSGKSTLLYLLFGSLWPDSGTILYDGVEADLWDLQALRGQFGVVLQHDRLFRGSVADNISCFVTLPNYARLREVARIACIWDDIAALPMGLRTQVGDAGTGFSGGQVQRILLARALYRRPRILFLDEATSHLDHRTERQVLDNLDALDLTVISVAHRDSVLARGDRVLRLTASA